MPLSLRGLWPLMLLLTAVRSLAAGQNSEELRLIGAGTTSPLPVYSKWFQEFQKIRPGLLFIYLPSGSETGIEMVVSSTADFGATDAPMTEKELTRANAVQFATMLIAVVPIYNLPGITQPLKFSPQALAGIYLGKVTRWNDPAIAGPNPGIQLPATAVTVVHGVAGSGTTYIWSDYLSKVSPEWRTRVGRGLAIKWPVGQDAEGNGNVARLVKETPDSIGYVELTYARKEHLSCGLVENSAGNFTAANNLSLAAAGAAAAKAPNSYLRNSITNAPGDKSYPIASFTWILTPGNMASANKREALKAFLRWTLNEGQAYTEAYGFGRLPKAMAQAQSKEIEKIP